MSWFALNATTSFCEDKYAVHPDVYEFYNTVSNFAYILCGLRTFYRLPGLSLALILIGVGSTLFHATGKLYGQLLDEGAMLLWISMLIVAIVPEKASRGCNFILVVSGVPPFVVYVYFGWYGLFLGLFASRVIGALGILWETNGGTFGEAADGVYLFGAAFVFWVAERALCGYTVLVVDFHVIWHFLSAASCLLLHEYVYEFRFNQKVEKKDGLDKMV